MLHAESKATIRLFNRAPKEDDKPGVTYPVMTGFIENGESRVQVGAFRQVNSKTKKEFLSLSIGNERDEQRFAGTLHRDEKPGREGHYFGYISESTYCGEEAGKPVYESGEWQLAISAKRVKPEGKKPYIGGDVYPSKKSSEAAHAASEEEDLVF
ncbi:hypothetical protein EGT07_23690 [Herbaspirillum sp. HC18]|nr:hypothetical protein EGT07_23690 [Herbaspirillum sp. HC18]